LLLTCGIGVDERDRVEGRSQCLKRVAREIHWKKKVGGDAGGAAV
jgi:hypothetical protein